MRRKVVRMMVVGTPLLSPSRKLNCFSLSEGGYIERESEPEPVFWHARQGCACAWMRCTWTHRLIARCIACCPLMRHCHLVGMFVCLYEHQVQTCVCKTHTLHSQIVLPVLFLARGTYIIRVTWGTNRGDNIALLLSIFFLRYAFLHAPCFIFQTPHLLIPFPVSSFWLSLFSSHIICLPLFQPHLLRK